MREKYSPDPQNEEVSPLVQNTDGTINPDYIDWALRRVINNLENGNSGKPIRKPYRTRLIYQGIQSHPLREITHEELLQLFPPGTVKQNVQDALSKLGEYLEADENIKIELYRRSVYGFRLKSNDE